MALNITELLSEFGAVFQGKATTQQLIAVLRAKNTLSAYFRNLATDDTVYDFATSDHDSGFQAFQKAFTATGDDTFGGRRQTVYAVKSDKKIFPDDAMNSWIGFLTDIGKAKKDYPLVQYIVDQTLLAVAADIEIAGMRGVYVAPTPGTAGTVLGSMHGILKQIVDAITATTITPIATSTVTASNVIDVIDSFVDGVSDAVMENSTYIFTNKQTARWLARKLDVRSVTDKDKLSPVSPLEVPYGDKVIVGLSSMASSGRIWTTPDINRVMITAKTPGQIRLQEIDREVKLLMDTKMVFTFRDYGIVAANDKT